MNMASIDRLGDMAANVTLHAAVNYVRSKNLSVTDYEAAAECIKRHCKGNLDVALRDAKEAIECGMTSAAEATFRLSMVQAGINAAKEFTAESCPVGVEGGC